MIRSREPRAGWTLVELLVSVTVLALFVGMAAWFAKGAAVHRISSERKLKLLDRVQQVMFVLENDLLSARRHTMGNLLCNNLLFNYNGNNWRTSSDPGFDSENTQLTNDPLVRNKWFFQAPAVMIPGPMQNAWAFIDLTPGGRFHGMGSLAIRCNLLKDAYYTVRSPDIINPKQQDYVLAGWVRGDIDSLGNVLVPQLSIQTSLGNGLPGASEIASVSASPLAANVGNWTYLSVQVPITQSGPFNVYLRTQVKNGNPNRVLSASFDEITLTPTTQIAAIDYTSAITQSVSDVNVDLNNRTDLGMVFFQTDQMDGSLKEMKYIFANGNQRVFPARSPDLLRISSSLPYFHPLLGLQWSGSGPPIPPLPNIRSLSVNWVGPWQRGANRPIQVTVSVVDPKDMTKTLSLTRVITPPTD